MVRGTLLATVRDTKIVGFRDEVEAALIAAERRGDFVACTRPQPLADGRVFVIARLREPVAAAAGPRRVRPALIVAGAAVLAVLGLVAWLLVTTVTAAGRWVGDHTAAVAIGVALLLLALAGVGRRCEITVIHRRH